MPGLDTAVDEAGDVWFRHFSLFSFWSKGVLLIPVVCSFFLVRGFQVVHFICAFLSHPFALLLSETTNV